MFHVAKKPPMIFAFVFFIQLLTQKKAMYEPPLFLEFFQKRIYKILKAMQSSNMY